MEDIRLFSPEFQADPYRGYAILRREAPVYQDPSSGSWVITRFADVYDALRDHETFSSGDGVAPAGPGMAGSLIASDPPRHTHLRSRVSKAFTPRVVERLRPRIDEILTGLLDRIDVDAFDIVSELAIPLPVAVIAELLGVSREDERHFRRWSEAIATIADEGLTDEAAGQIGELGAYFARAIAERKLRPRSDLVSALALAEVDGKTLTEAEVLDFCQVLLLGGNETTTNLIANLVDRLIDESRLWQALDAEPSLVEAAIEESLRIDSPVQILGRRATRDVVLHGTTIPKGSWVLLCYGAANRDEEEFPDPDTFRLDRGLAQHLAFGHGIHFCLGAPLARAETRAVLCALLSRFERIERGIVSARRIEANARRGFRELPVRAVPARATSVR